MWDFLVLRIGWIESLHLFWLPLLSSTDSQGISISIALTSRSYFRQPAFCFVLFDALTCSWLKFITSFCFPLLCWLLLASLLHRQAKSKSTRAITSQPTLIACRALLFHLQSGENSLALQFCFVFPALTSTCSCLNVFIVMVLLCVLAGFQMRRLWITPSLIEVN